VRSPRLVACAVALIMLAGCDASAAGAHHHEGTVIGRFIRAGGPATAGKPSPVLPLSGTVRFTRKHGSKVSVHVGTSGRFTVRLPAGRYAVAGRSAAIDGGKSPCLPRKSIRVRERRTVHLTVVCSIS
jgi:hypothetical protein